jgi:KDO2-lipid IV(A) lauroyltransferase
MTALELGPIWRRPVPALRGVIEAVEGEEDFQQAISKGKGVIILAPHIGAWELFAIYLGDKEPFTALYQPPDNPAMHELINTARSRTGIKVAPTNIKGVKILLQNLKKGEVIGILPDQVPRAEGGEFAPFFGVPALTTTLVSNLVKRTGAQVVVGSALRIARSGKFKIVFRPVPATIASADINVALGVLNKSVEECVEQAPEQYQWEYKRFKKQPGGERKYYQKR